MEKTIKLVCALCSKEFDKRLIDYTRAFDEGRRDFYCSRKCAGIAINAKRNKWVREIRKCPVCGKEFETEYSKGYTGNNVFKKNGATFCSRSCASKGSVTEYRSSKARDIAKQNFIPADINSCKHLNYEKEKWKYVELQEYLDRSGIDYEFEYILEDRLYDLFLSDKKILIEFDGINHNNKSFPEDIVNDKYKDLLADKNNLKLVRVKVKSGEVIPVSSIEGII